MLRSLESNPPFYLVADGPSSIPAMCSHMVSPMLTPRVRIIDPVDRDLVDAETIPLGLDEQLCIEEPFVVLDLTQEGESSTSRRIALNPHCASENREWSAFAG